MAGFSVFVGLIPLFGFFKSPLCHTPYSHYNSAIFHLFSKRAVESVAFLSAGCKINISKLYRNLKCTNGVPKTIHNFKSCFQPK